MSQDRMTGGGYNPFEDEMETSLRPRSLTEYFGQQPIKDSLSIYMQAANLRHEPLEKIEGGAFRFVPPGEGCLRPASAPCLGREGSLFCTCGGVAFRRLRARPYAAPAGAPRFLCESGYGRITS